ncbi:MAG: GNAT family N-acetyltransferase [Saprospiraceae bacterium]
MEALSIDQLRESINWSQLAELPYWLSSEWLRVLAKAGAPESRYLAFYRKGKIIGVCLLQTLPVTEMKLGENVRPQMASIVFGGVLEQFGQALYSANGGMHFNEDENPSHLISLARQSLAKHSSSCCYLMKDVHNGTAEDGWQKLQALPEMVMSIPAEWSCFEDYLVALPSKYRKRVKRARKKFEGLTTRLLSVEEAVSFRQNIDQLYDQLLQRSPYVPYRVPPGYVTTLKVSAPERVELRGYFKDEEMVGFSTFLVGEDESIAHYCAIDPAYNPSHQLYLNLLLDLLQASIERGVSKVHFGRTATTIKSSVGAVPLTTYSFASHDGCIRHQLLTVLNNRVLANAEEELIQRPFG